MSPERVRRRPHRVVRPQGCGCGRRSSRLVRISRIGTSRQVDRKRGRYRSHRGCTWCAHWLCCKSFSRRRRARLLIDKHLLALMVS